MGRGMSPEGVPRTCGQVEDVVEPPVGRGHPVHGDPLVAVLVVEQGAPGGPQRLHPLLHLGVAVRDLEGLAGRVLPRGDALRGQKGDKRSRQSPESGGESSAQRCHCDSVSGASKILFFVERRDRLGFTRSGR